MPHKDHPRCEHNSKAACEKAIRAAFGQCSELVGDKNPRPCTRWGVDLVDGLPICGQHITARVTEKLVAARRIAAKADVNARIERYIAWRADHPSVWDMVPKELK